METDVTLISSDAARIKQMRQNIQIIFHYFDEHVSISPSLHSRTLRRLFFRITFTPSPRASSSSSKGPLSSPLSRSDLLSPDLSQPLTQVLFAHYLEPLVVEGDQTVSRDLFEALLQAAESNHHVTPVIQ